MNKSELNVILKECGFKRDTKLAYNSVVKVTGTANEYSATSAVSDATNTHHYNMSYKLSGLLGQVQGVHEMPDNWHFFKLKETKNKITALMLCKSDQHTRHRDGGYTCTMFLRASYEEIDKETMKIIFK